jgi:hypothetical protein
MLGFNLEGAGVRCQNIVWAFEQEKFQPVQGSGRLDAAGGKESVMQPRSTPFLSRLALAVCLGSLAAAVPALGSTGFSIAAPNVTMPASGNGSTQYTVTGIPITGTLNVTCQYSGPSTEANLPTCTYGPVHAPMQVNAGQTVTGDISFYPYGAPIPASSQRPGRAAPKALAIAGTLLLGLGFLGRRGGRPLLIVLVGASLAGALGLSACTGPMNAMTPGAYQYTLQAANVGTLNNLAAGASTNITVTVP